MLSIENQAKEIDRHYRLDQVYENPFKRFLRNNKLVNLKLYYNTFLWKRYSSTILPKCKYFYFSLHVQPETSSTLYSEYLLDTFSQQGWLIEQLAKQLPQGTVLVVKDHPFMLDKRMAKTYKRLFDYPQVYFMTPWSNQFDIIRNSVGVVTAVGTVGVEARMLNKPVCLLENTYYRSMDVSFVNRVKDVSEFFNHAINSSSTDSELKDFEVLFLAKLKNAIYEGVENAIVEFFPNQESDENITKLVSGLLEEYQYRKYL